MSKHNLAIKLIEEEIRHLEGSIQSSYTYETDHKAKMEMFPHWRSFTTAYDADKYYQERKSDRDKIVQLDETLELLKEIGDE